MATAPSEKEVPAGGAGSGKKKLVMLALILVIGVVLGIGGYFAFKMVKSASSANKGAPEGPPPRLLVEMKDSVIVNIKEYKGVRYFRIKLGMIATVPPTMEKSKAKDKVQNDVKNIQPLINDYLIERLGDATISEVDNKNGRNQLKSDIMSRINELLANPPENTGVTTAAAGGEGGGAAEGGAAEGGGEHGGDKGGDKIKITQIIFTDFIIQ